MSVKNGLLHDCPIARSKGRLTWQWLGIVAFNRMFACWHLFEDLLEWPYSRVRVSCLKRPKDAEPPSDLLIPWIYNSLMFSQQEYHTIP